MLETDALRTRLAELASVLRECDEETMAAYVSDAAEGTEAAMNAFLASNELWGGPGSVADQAGMRPGRTDARRRIEAGQKVASNTAQQRTRSAPLRSPLSSKTLGAASCS
jgi:hypothetical protein